MGGYAAIKYSAALGATHVIAYCPQWSIDKQECGDNSPGWQEYFLPSMVGMGISSSDVAGQLYLFADNFDHGDKFHVEKIVQAYPRTRCLNVPFVGHHITTVFAGTEKLADVLAACRGGDLQALAGIARRARRASPFYETNLLSRAPARRPKQLLQYFRGRDLRPDTHSLAQHIAVLSFRTSPDKKMLSLQTTHNSILAYFLEFDRCMHVAEGSLLLGSVFWPVRLNLKAKSGSLICDARGFQIALGVDHQGFLTSVFEPGGDVFDVAISPSGRFTLKNAERFLCAEPLGGVICNRAEAADWEQFYLG